jgi:hypothetical protein
MGVNENPASMSPVFAPGTLPMGVVNPVDWVVG